MRQSFKTELLFSLEVGFLENDILSQLLTTTRTNVTIIINNNNSNKNNNSKTRHTGLEIDIHKDIDW